MDMDGEGAVGAPRSPLRSVADMRRKLETWEWLVNQAITLYFVHEFARDRSLPEAPAVVAGAGRAAILLPDGEIVSATPAEAASLLGTLGPPLLLHAPATLRRLGLRAMPAYDLLELFAFVLPARSAAPTPLGLALALDLDPPGRGMEAAAAVLPDIAAALLQRLAAGRHTALNRGAAGLAARSIARAGAGDGRCWPHSGSRMPRPRSRR